MLFYEGQGKLGLLDEIKSQRKKLNDLQELKEVALQCQRCDLPIRSQESLALELGRG